MANITHTHHTIPAPHPVTGVTTSNSNDSVSNSDRASGSISNQHGMAETPTNYPHNDNRHHPYQFSENMTMAYSPATQETIIRPIASNSTVTWMTTQLQQQQHFHPELYPQSIPRNTNIRLARSRNHPYFCRESNSISHQTRIEENNILRHTFNNPSNSSASISLSQTVLTQSQSQRSQENFEFVNTTPENGMLVSQHQQSGQETSSAATIETNNSVGVTMRGAIHNNASQNLTNVMQTQTQIQTGSSVAVTSGIDSLDSASTLPVQHVVRQLEQTIESPNCTTEQRYQAVRMLRNDPRLMAAFIKQRSVLLQYGNLSNNIPIMTTNQQAQSNVTNKTTQNPTEQPKFPCWNTRIMNNQSSYSQSGLMMTGGSMTVSSSSAIPNYSSAVGAMQNQSNSQHDNVNSHGDTNPLNNSTVSEYQTLTAETRRWNASSWNSHQPSSSSSIYPPLEVSNSAASVKDVNSNRREGFSGMASNSEPAVTAVLQLAAARQLIVQAAASAAAAGATSLSQTLNDRSCSLDRVVKIYLQLFYSNKF